MDLNNADARQPCGEVRSRSGAGGVQAAGNSMTGIFPRSSSENKFIPESFRNRTSGFKERLEMRLGGLLKPQGSFATVPPMRVTTLEQGRFGDPYAVFILPQLYFRKGNNHRAFRLAQFGIGVKHDWQTELEPRNSFCMPLRCGARDAHHRERDSRAPQCVELLHANFLLLVSSRSDGRRRVGGGCAWGGWGGQGCG